MLILVNEWIILCITIGAAYYIMAKYIAVDYFKNYDVGKKFLPIDVFVMSFFAAAILVLGLFVCMDIEGFKISPLLTGEFSVTKAIITSWKQPYRTGEPIAVFRECGTNHIWKYAVDNIPQYSNVGEEVLLQHCPSLREASVLAVGKKDIEMLLQNGIPSIDDVDVYKNIICLIMWSIAVTMLSTLMILYRWFKPHKVRLVKRRKVQCIIFGALLFLGWFNLFLIIISARSFAMKTHLELMADVSYDLLLIYFVFCVLYTLPWGKIGEAYRDAWKQMISD